MSSYQSASDFGLLILRVVLGFTMAAHGYNKAFGDYFGGISGAAGWFDSIGIKPGGVHVRLAVVAEIAAGLAIAIGLLTPVASAAFIALMLVAAWTVHREHGFFIMKNGWEYNLVLAVGALTLSATGAGRFSFDYLLFASHPIVGLLRGWTGLAIAAICGLTGGIAQLAFFYRAPAPQQPE